MLHIEDLHNFMQSQQIANVETPARLFTGQIEECQRIIRQARIEYLRLVGNHLPGAVDEYSQAIADAIRNGQTVLQAINYTLKQAYFSCVRQAQEAGGTTNSVTVINQFGIEDDPSSGISIVHQTVTHGISGMVALQYAAHQLLYDKYLTAEYLQSSTKRIMTTLMRMTGENALKVEGCMGMTYCGEAKDLHSYIDIDTSRLELRFEDDEPHIDITHSTKQIAKRYVEKGSTYVGCSAHAIPMQNGSGAKNLSQFFQKKIAQLLIEHLRS